MSFVGEKYISGVNLADIAIQSTTLPSLDEQLPTQKRKSSKKHVSFNLSNIQIQSIPSSFEENDEPLVVLPSNKKNPPYPPPPVIATERISKKETYDALQQRKLMRRYWYPLRLEKPKTEECSPNIENANSSKSKKEPVYYPVLPLRQNLLNKDDDETLFPSPLSTGYSVLVPDSDDDSDENQAEDAHTIITSFQHLTPSLVKDDIKHSHEHSNSDTDDSDVSLNTPSPEPHNTGDYLGLNEGFLFEDIFNNSKSPLLKLPFEEKFMSISSKTSMLLKKPIPVYPAYKKRRILFVKVSKAEKLDLPIQYGRSSNTLKL